MNNKNRKGFWAGLITGLIIALFLGSCGLCLKILLDDKGKKAESVVEKQLEENETKKDSPSQIVGVGSKDTDTETDTNEEDSEELYADDGYVLADEDVVQKIMMLEDTIDQYYVDSVSNSAIEESIYDGIMESLEDPYAEYYSAEEYKELMESNEGIYYGVGAYLQKDTTTLYPKITGIIKNSPVEESSLMVGDYIVAVNGEDIYDMDLSEAVLLIKGQEGTTVTLSIVRSSTGESFDEVLERRKIESPTVEYEMKEDKIAYIQITEFDQVTVDQFAEALNNAKSDGMKGLILDLRGNPGGSLSAVVQIGQMILPKGLIVYTEDKYGNRDEYESDGKNELDIPMVVLINGGSASASEILAGAIKDYGMATLVGTTSFGKGIVQRIVDYADGSAVKLTVSHYYTPNGNDIHQLGIEPDIELEFDSDAYLEDNENDNQLDKAIEILKGEVK